jgi:thiamine biosynthesis lipoprotein ApbE
MLQNAIDLALELHLVTHGRFNPSLYSHCALWHSSLRDQGTPPSAMFLQALRSRTPPFSQCFRRGSAGELIAGAPIDLDAISKGIGVDAVYAALYERIDVFFFDWGGEICAKGDHPSGRAWRTSVIQVLILFLSFCDFLHNNRSHHHSHPCFNHGANKSPCIWM